MPKKLSRSKEDLTRIRKAQEGDEAAFSSIIEEHEPNLRGVAFGILKKYDDVDDALQTVRIKVWKKIRTFDPGKGAKLSTWLHKFMKNTCLDMLDALSTQGADKRGLDDQLSRTDNDDKDKVDGDTIIVTVGDRIMADGWWDDQIARATRVPPPQFASPGSSDDDDDYFPPIAGEGISRSQEWRMAYDALLNQEREQPEAKSLWEDDDWVLDALNKLKDILPDDELRALNALAQQWENSFVTLVSRTLLLQARALLAHHKDALAVLGDLQDETLIWLFDCLDYDGSDDGSDDDDDDDWYKPTPAVELSPAEKAWLGRNERRPPKLSAREERIRKGLMEGKTRKEIAKKEGITASALNTAICRINKKFTEKV